MLHRHDIPVHELNIGGVGVQHTDSDTLPDMTTFITRISQLVQQQFKATLLCRLYYLNQAVYCYCRHYCLHYYN